MSKKVPRVKVKVPRLKLFDNLVVWKDSQERKTSKLASHTRELQDRVKELENSFNQCKGGEINLVEVQAILRKMLEYSPNHFPTCPKGHALNPYKLNKKILDEDSTAPFFSEAYLYNLMGKDEARVVLSLVNQLCKELGVNING